MIARSAEFRVFAAIYAVCLVIGQLWKPEVGGVPITTVDILIVGMLPVVILRLHTRLAAYGAIALFLAPNVVIGIAYLNAGTIDALRLLMGLYSCYRLIFPFLLVFCYAEWIGERDRRYCGALLMFALGAHVVFGLVQAAALPNFALDYGPKVVSWDYQEHRLVSTFLDPNLVSSLYYSAVMIMLCRVIVIEETLGFSEKVLLMGSLVAAVLTASRGGALGFAMTFMLLIIASKRLTIIGKIKWVSITVVTVAVLFAVFIEFFGSEFIAKSNRFGLDNWSVAERLVNIAILIKTFLAEPVFGQGFNFLPYLASTDFVSVTGNYADGGLLYLLASGGIWGTIWISVLVISAIRTLTRPALLFYPVVLLVIQSMTTSSMYYPILTIFVVLLALAWDEGPAEFMEAPGAVELEGSGTAVGV